MSIIKQFSSNTSKPIKMVKKSSLCENVVSNEEHVLKVYLLFIPKQWNWRLVTQVLKFGNDHRNFALHERCTNKTNTLFKENYWLVISARALWGTWEKVPRVFWCLTWTLYLFYFILFISPTASLMPTNTSVVLCLFWSPNCVFRLPILRINSLNFEL